MLTKDQAHELVVEAVRRVDPNAFGPPGRIGNMGVRVDQRGDRFDVGLAQASLHLQPEFREAIQETLGAQFATIRFY